MEIWDHKRGEGVSAENEVIGRRVLGNRVDVSGRPVMATTRSSAVKWKRLWMEGGESEFSSQLFYQPTEQPCPRSLFLSGSVFSSMT